MHKEKLEDLINKFFLQNLSDEEKIEFEDLLKSSSEARKIFRHWSFVYRSTNAIQLSRESTTPKLNSPINSNQKIISIWIKQVMRVAAVIAIPLIIGLLYVLMNQQDSSLPNIHELVYQNNNGKAVSVMLPDSSKVILYAHSTLKYPSQFTNKERRVNLIGEATFEVVSDLKHPFYVETIDGLVVKAYGTKFKVYGVEDDDIVEVYLERGKVNFSSPCSAIPTEMEPSTKLEFNTKNKSLRILSADQAEYAAYEKGILLFRSESLEQIAQRLSRMYGVKIEIRDNEIRQYPITGTFKDESITQIMDMLKLSTPGLTWKKEGGKIILLKKK